MRFINFYGWSPRCYLEPTHEEQTKKEAAKAKAKAGYVTITQTTAVPKGGYPAK